MVVRGFQCSADSLYCVSLGIPILAMGAIAVAHQPTEPGIDADAPGPCRGPELSQHCPGTVRAAVLRPWMLARRPNRQRSGFRGCIAGFVQVHHRWLCRALPYRRATTLDGPNTEAHQDPKTGSTRIWKAREYVHEVIRWKMDTSRGTGK